MEINLSLKRYCVIFLLIFTSIIGYAQTPTQQLFFGPQTDTNIKSVDKEPLTRSLTNFLKSINSNSLHENSGIDPNHLKNDINPFPFLMDVQKSWAHQDDYFYKPVVSYVVPENDDDYIIKIAFMGIQPDSKTPILRMVLSLLAKKDGNQFKFYPPLEVYTSEWNKKQVGKITYHYRDTLDMKIAQQFSEFNSKFAKKLETETIAFDYYKCRDPREMFYILGCDYTINTYFSKTGGFAHAWRNHIFSANNSEWYPHELTHLYTAQKFGQSLNRIADEGYCTYIGGSGEMALDVLIDNVNGYLFQKPNADILDLFLSDHQINGKSSFMYSISGLLMQKIDQLHGLKGIEKIIMTSNNGDAYFQTLEELLGINRANFSEKVVSLLKENK